jgi:hypothetical protein
LRRRISTFSALAAALACAAATAPAATAATPEPAPPPAQVAGLLDAPQQQLQTLIAALGAGQAPTGTLLVPVHDLLDDLAATPGLPPATQQLVRQIADLLISQPAGQPLDPALLGQVATLLRGLAATDGVPATAAALLNDLADVLAAGDVAGLTGGVLRLPPELIRQVGDVLTALEDGQAPTGTLLAPVADLFDQVAATPGLAAPVPELLRTLSDSIDGTSGALDPLVVAQVSRALTAVARTPGLTPSQQATIAQAATALAQRAGTQPARAATRRDRAVVKRIRLNRARTRVSVRIACPRSAPATCATTVRARFAGRKAANGKRVRIGAGRTKVVRLKLLRGARTASARDGGRLRVRVVTAFPGGKRFAHVKSVGVKPRHRR